MGHSQIIVVSIRRTVLIPFFTLAFFSHETRYKLSPMGGEISYYTNHDQQNALNPEGPHGISFEDLASQDHISYMRGNDQPYYQSIQRIRDAGMATGYRFKITSFEASATSSRGVVENIGIAPIYYDAWPTVNNLRSPQSLKGLARISHQQSLPQM